MERLTTVLSGNVYYAKGLYEQTLCAEMEIWDIRKCMQKLAEYEDTELTPEEIKAQQHNLGVFYNVISELEKDRDDWKYEALTYSKWFSENGTKIDEILKFCKTMFPDTKYSE